jgi:diguanylate cyclase (GGDEF)-like protein/PAS domain S-box-containing protein
MEITKQLGRGCFLGIPLYHKNGQVFGTLCAIDNNKCYDFTEKEIELLQTMGKFLSYVITMEDESLERYQTLIKNSTDVFVVIEKTGLIKYLSPAIQSVLGREIEKTTKTIIDYVHPEERNTAVEFLKGIIHSPNLTVLKNEFRALHSNGLWIDCEVTAQNLQDDPSIKGIVLNFRDITDKKAAELKIRHMAFHDDLTRLPNRRAFEKRVSEEIEKESNALFSILCLDVDRFRFVNDNFGFKVGDSLLIEISKRLKSELMEEDMVARMGNDQFLILFTNLVSMDDIHEKIEKVRQLFIDVVSVNNYEFNITPSIGVSFYQGSEDTVDSLLKHADIALYRAKEQGVNKYKVYTPTMDVETYKTFILENDMRVALELGQLSVHYQPKVNVNSNKIIGIEALIRWEHPIWGQISPDEWIPLAEESGYIIKIGEWILKTACIQNKRWQETGLPSIPISVNLSGHQLMHKDVVEVIENCLNISGLDGKWLELEITENILIGQNDLVVETINKIKKLDVRFSLDDFGTGYSSLSFLKHYKVDTLKIDKSFIRDIKEKPESEHIIEAIIKLASGLNMDIIAEGVENLHQLEVLQKLNCTKIQGYLYSKPVTGDKMEILLRTGYINPEPKEWQSIKQENRREFFRIKLNYPIIAHMTIVEVRQKQINVGSTEVLIQNIGPGGLRFISKVKLPVNPDFILSLKTTIFQDYELHGNIVWTQEYSQHKDEKVFEYGFKFLLDEKSQEDLTKVLNQLAIKLKKQPIFPGVSFFTESVQAFFK